MHSALEPTGPFYGTSGILLKTGESREAAAAIPVLVPVCYECVDLHKVFFSFNRLSQ